MHAPLHDPGGTVAPDHRALALPLQRDDVAFRYFDASAPTTHSFRGSITRPARSLSTLRGPPSPTVHARLASGWWSSLAGRESNALGPLVRFQPCPLHDILLTQAFPGAPKSRLNTPPIIAIPVSAVIALGGALVGAIVGATAGGLAGDGAVISVERR